jgi:hypothetical protein
LKTAQRPSTRREAYLNDPFFMPMTGGRDNRPQLTLRTTAFIALSFGPSILRRSAGPPGITSPKPVADQQRQRLG